jgi:hypothetical protein
MPKTIFDQIPKDDRDPILGMLRCITDYEDEFVNEVHYMSSSEGHEYFVQSRNHRRTSVSHRFRHIKSLSPTLMRLGLITPHSHTSFEFRQEAIDAYRTRNFVPNAEIQRRIGEEVHGHWRKHRHDMHDERLDVDALAAELGVERDRIIDSLDVMHRAGILHESRYSHQGTLDLGYAYLADRGFEWSNAGFPDIATWNQSRVNVAVHVTLQQYIQQVEALPISDDDKAKFERLLRRIEEEGKNDEPSYKPVQDALDMLSKIKELAPIGIKFFSDHMDTIQRMAGRMPGV